VVGVALLGGFRPALLATVTGVLAADFFCTQPYYSLRVTRLVDVIGLVTFAIVAAAVGGLVDRLTRQGVQTARARAEAEDLARLAADTLIAPGPLEQAIASVRDVFDLDGVAVLRRDGTTWQVEATSGRIRLTDPDQAGYSVELTRDRVLVLSGSRLTSQDAALLGVFLAQLRIRREQVILDALRAGEPKRPSGRQSEPRG